MIPLSGEGKSANAALTASGAWDEGAGKLVVAPEHAPWQNFVEGMFESGVTLAEPGTRPSGRQKPHETAAAAAL